MPVPADPAQVVPLIDRPMGRPGRRGHWIRTWSLAALLLGMTLASGCGTAAVLPATSIGVRPAETSLAEGDFQQFQAVVAGGAAVLWSVQPASAGTITASGLFTAVGPPGVCAVVAQLRCNPNLATGAKVTVRPSPAAARMAVNPADAQATRGALASGHSSGPT